MRLRKLFLWGLVLLGFITFLSLGYIYYRQNKFLISFHSHLEKEINSFPGKVGLIFKILKFKRAHPLFGKKIDFYFNPHLRFKAASVIKLPLLVVCLKSLKDKNLDLSKKFVLKKRFITGGSGILKNRKPGEKYSLYQLLRTMIVYSDNTSSNMIIAILGKDFINEKFKELGLTNTFLERNIMDLYARRRGKENYVSAQDCQKILEDVYRKKFGKVNSSMMISFLLAQQVRDRLPRYLPSDVYVAHKTGLERGVVHDVGIIFSPQADYILVILTESKLSYRKAKKFIARLSKIIYDYIENFPYDYRD